MLNPDTELVFPIRVLPHLKHLRSEIWESITEKVIERPNDLSNQMAFTLMMTKIAGCLTCDSDSFRAIRGCTLCTQQALKRYRGSDKELEILLNKSQEKVKKYLEKRIEEITG